MWRGASRCQLILWKRFSPTDGLRRGYRKPDLPSAGSLSAGRGAGDVWHAAEGKFIASGTQLVVTALIAAILIVAAFVLFRPGSDKSISSGPARWRPLSLGLLAFVAGSVFHLVKQLGSSYLAPWVAVVIALALPVGMIAVVRAARQSGAWTEAHTDALMLGGLAAYGWLGFFLTVRMHGADSIPGQFFPFVIIMALVYWRFIRQPRTGDAGK